MVELLNRCVDQPPLLLEKLGMAVCSHSAKHRRLMALDGYAGAVDPITCKV
jgi:hypothetical protein